MLFVRSRALWEHALSDPANPGLQAYVISRVAHGRKAGRPESEVDPRSILVECTGAGAADLAGEAAQLLDRWPKGAPPLACLPLISIIKGGACAAPRCSLAQARKFTLIYYYLRLSCKLAFLKFRS